MREVKFRYVLKVYNTSRDDPAYYEWLELPIFTLSELEHNGLDKWILKNVEGIIETAAKNQFTGLRDKNGKEIYEGDILSYHSKKGWEVFFEDGCYYMMYGDHSFLFEKMRAIESEIIGNIYENPKLLEGK